MTDVANKTVLITGAASGIGALLSEKLFQLGAQLVLWDIDSEGLQRVAAKFDSSSVFCQTVDLANREQIRDASEVTLRDVGPVDVLINNAGVVSGEYLLDLTDEQIEQTIAINTLAPIWLTRAFMPGMINQGHGRIVNVASAAGLVGAVKMTDYCASKFAAVGFNEALRLETKSLKQPIQTTVVCPFFVDTGMFDGVQTRVPFLLPLLEPDSVAERIINAILRDQPRVLMPRLIHSISPSRLLPVSLFDRILGWLGVTTSMTLFADGDRSFTSRTAPYFLIQQAPFIDTALHIKGGLRSTIGGHLGAISAFKATNSCHLSGTLSSWKIASTGHSGRHASQSMHSFGSMYSICSPSRKQSQGQTTTQSVNLQPKHGLVTT